MNDLNKLAGQGTLTGVWDVRNGIVRIEINGDKSPFADLIFKVIQIVDPKEESTAYYQVTRISRNQIDFSNYEPFRR